MYLLHHVKAVALGLEEGAFKNRKEKQNFPHISTQTRKRRQLLQQRKAM